MVLCCSVCFIVLVFFANLKVRLQRWDGYRAGWSVSLNLCKLVTSSYIEIKKIKNPLKSPRKYSRSYSVKEAVVICDPCHANVITLLTVAASKLNNCVCFSCISRSCTT